LAEESLAPFPGRGVLEPLASGNHQSASKLLLSGYSVFDIKLGAEEVGVGRGWIQEAYLISLSAFEALTFA
jgi:hypothetical protein